MRDCKSMAVWLVAAALGAGVQARAQSAQAPAEQKNTAQKFPFPGEAPSTAEKPAAATPDAPSADAPPAAPQVKTPRVAPPAYPGDPDAPAAGSGSSSSSSSAAPYNPDADDAGPLKDAGSSGEDTKLPPPPERRKKLPKTKPAIPETPESRTAEDLTVAEFYMNDGNYAAAYLRAKDAVQYQPDDPYTHFALAEAARKLGKQDEAKTHYEKVLALDPIPKQKKAAERALAEMGATARK